MEKEAVDFQAGERARAAPAGGIKVSAWPAQPTTTGGAHTANAGLAVVAAGKKDQP